MIKEYYDTEGNLLKRVTTIDIEPIREKVGEYLISPKKEDVVLNPLMKETIDLVLNRARLKPINLLLFGGAGTGKTTIGKMFAVELSRPFVYLNGEMNVEKVREIMLNLKDNSLVLLDEIHNLREKVAEILYPAVQDGEIGDNGKIIYLNNVMFVGTTTEPERLPKPLLDRFKQIELSELGKEELKKVLIKKGCEEKSADILLNYSTNMRILNNLLDMCNLYGSPIEPNIVKVFRLKNINIYSGLSKLQEDYLSILKKSDKPIGLRLLCLKLGKSEDYLKLEVEGELIKKGMILVTSRGRQLSETEDLKTPSHSKEERTLLEL